MRIEAKVHAVHVHVVDIEQEVAVCFFQHRAQELALAQLAAQVDVARRVLDGEPAPEAIRSHVPSMAPETTSLMVWPKPR